MRPFKKVLCLSFLVSNHIGIACVHMCLLVFARAGIHGGVCAGMHGHSWMETCLQRSVEWNAHAIACHTDEIS